MFTTVVFATWTTGGFATGITTGPCGVTGATGAKNCAGGCARTGIGIGIGIGIGKMPAAGGGGGGALTIVTTSTGGGGKR